MSKEELPVVEMVRIEALGVIAFPPYIGNTGDKITLPKHLADVLIKDGVAVLFVPPVVEAPLEDTKTPLSVDGNLSGLDDLFNKQVAATEEPAEEPADEKKKKK